LKREVILEIDSLVTVFNTESGRTPAVDNISFDVAAGRTCGIVGESGCGKSVTALSIMRLLPHPAGIIESGEVLFQGTDLVSLSPGEMHRIRGNRIAMIFQEPMTALNPVQKIGKQMKEVFRLHADDMSHEEASEEALKLLKRVGIPDPANRLKEYPHQISGGMRQRVMIAMALAARPDILIADEPTTALDVTIQAQILTLVEDLQKETGMSVIFITHDLGVIAQICDDVVVMYAGKIAETATALELFSQPKHPYTRGLLDSMPRLDSKRKSRLQIIKGMVPALDEMPDGCRFENRCPHGMAICKREHPSVTAIGGTHSVSCHLYSNKSR